MKEILNHPHCSSKPRSSRNKNFKEFLKSMFEKEKLQRKQQWLIQQERKREYERQKRRIILEYELQRTYTKDLGVRNKALLLLGHEDLPRKTLPKCSECMQIISAELHKIRIDIHRNGSSKILSCKLQKDVNHSEDVLFGIRKSGDVFKAVYKSGDFKKPIDRSNSPRFRSSYNSRYSFSERNRTRREHGDRYNHFRHRSSKNAMNLREYRGRSRDRSVGWRDSSQTFIKHVSVPVPAYYRNLPQNRSMKKTMIESMVQFPGPNSALRSRYPNMEPMGLFPSRFISPNLYRFGENPNYTVNSGVSFVLSAILTVLVFSGMQMYRAWLSSSQLYTILGGYIGSILFLCILTAVGNLEATIFGKSFQQKLFPEVIFSLVVSLIASGLVHRVATTTCFIFSMIALYYINRISQDTYSIPVATMTTHTKKRK